MIRYAATGLRRYGERPMPPHIRNVWEIQAVTAGSCSLWLPGSRGPLRERMLWLFPPRHEHGWAAPRDCVCRVAVLHLTILPEPLRRLVEADGMLEVGLSDSLARTITALARQAAGLRPEDPLTPLHAGVVAAQLCLAIASILPAERFGRLQAEPAQLVDAALGWYREHLAEAPSVEAIARSAGISASHFRRLFRTVQGRSLHQTLTDIRLQHADELLRDPAVKLEEVAVRAGFGSGSAFSRAFRRERGFPPAHWARRRRGRPARNLPPALPAPPLP